MTEQKHSDHSLKDLRDRLFEALDGVRAGTLDFDRARLVNEIGKTLIDSAKVEVDFIRATDGTSSEFLGGPSPKVEQKPVGITSVFQHRIGG